MTVAPAAGFLAIVVALVLMEWRIGLAAWSQHFRYGMYLFTNLVVSLDLFDLLARVYFRRVHTEAGADRRAAPSSIALDVGSFTPYQVRSHLRPWAMVVSVRNLGGELAGFVSAFAAYREHLWVIDDDSSDDTCERLRTAGVRCQRGSPNRRKPGALKVLLAGLPREVVTIVVLDPDVQIHDRIEGRVSVLERVLFEFQRSRMAALCPRIGIRPDGWLASFQEFEYAMAFALGRKSMGDHCVTSGVAVYRRDALEWALGEHTLSVYAEDLRNAILLLARGERIYYDGRLYVETEGKRTVRGWFSQRVGWFYGLLKVYVEHLRELVRLADRQPFLIYQFLIYLGVLSILCHPLKLFGAALLVVSAGNGADEALGLHLIPDNAYTEPWYFLLAYLRYLIVATLALWLARSRGQRARLALLIPVYLFYSLAQLVPATIGYLNWIGVRLGLGRLYRDHYQDEATLAAESEDARRSA